MRLTKLNCNTCSKEFEKQTKEIKRCIKVRPNCKFYCSLKCSGKQQTKHLISFADDPELQKRASLAGRGKGGPKSPYSGVAKNMHEYFKRCRGRTKHECNITVEYLNDVWLSQAGRCAISNIPLELDATDYIQMPSVDRIDSSRGYVVGNVHFISCALNLAKSTMSVDRMHALLKLVCNNYQG